MGADEIRASLEALGAKLRETRVSALLTQAEVGQRAGVSRQLVNRIEQGCNGEISAYIAVATVLRYRFALIPDDVAQASDQAGLDFTQPSMTD